MSRRLAVLESRGAKIETNRLVHQTGRVILPITSTVWYERGASFARGVVVSEYAHCEQRMTLV